MQADDLDPVGLKAATAAVDRLLAKETDDTLSETAIADAAIRAYLKALRDKGPQL